MDFQLSLPYAADSDLHVIAGLDVTGTPIYQRPGDWRMKPVDMYTLLQGIIERCLATQQADGSYLVSPVIFNQTESGGEFASISQWTERTYPDGVLNEVSGYVSNLMDNYPSGLLLKAIDDKLWALGNCSSGVHETESCYGSLMDTPPYWSAFWDITFAMTQAGVGFDPVSFEMLAVPARVSESGEDEYGPPGAGSRIYPEVLIARYKVMQQLRYTKANWYGPRPKTGGAIGNGAYDLGGMHGLYGPMCTREEFIAALNLAEDDWKSKYAIVLGDEVTLNTQAAIDLFMQLRAGLWESYGISPPNWYGFNYTTGVMAANRYMSDDCTYSAYFRTKAYGIKHAVKMWGESPSDYTWGYTQANGNPLVAGKNLMWDLDVLDSNEQIYDIDLDLRAEVWPPGNYPPLWPVDAGGVGEWGYSQAVQLYAPINDWEFQFCKASEFGGDVTWIP